MNTQSVATKRAVIVCVSQFGEAPLEDLPVAPELIRDLAQTLDDLGYATVTLDSGPLPSKDLGAAIRQQWEAAGADDLLIIHVLSHGHPADANATVYVLGSDGAVDDSADVDHWLKGFQNVKGRPATLMLLDLCSSGTAARLPWQQGMPAEDTRAWVIAACPPEQSAFDGRFTQAVAKVLAALRDGELDTDPARTHVPLTVVARAIRREVNRLTEVADGYPQQVTASLVDLSAEVDLPFFGNPKHLPDKQARLRAAVDPGLLPFVDDLDSVLDPRHFLERAAGMGGLAQGEIVGCFTGRDRQLAMLSLWMNGVDDELLMPGTLCVVTGSPGVGKSALLGILICAAHPRLRAPTKPVWDRAAQVPYPVRHLAAVHARGRDAGAVEASVARQLGLAEPPAGSRPAGSPPAGGSLAGALAESTGPVPVIVVDALDEADDGAGLMARLLLPLSATTRRDGKPAARLLVGVRGYEEYRPLLDAAAGKGALIDLDAVPAGEVENNLNRYVTDLLRTTTAYRPRGGVTGEFASRLASVLASGDGDWGPFLVAGLYTRHIIAATAERPMDSVAEAARAANDAPRDLPAVLEMDLRANTGRPWLRAVMSVLARARGQGMPLSVIARCAAAFAGEHAAGEGPGIAEIRETLDAGRVYLRQSADKDGTSVYRLFHQGLTEALSEAPFREAPGLLAAVLAPLGPPHARDWDAAEPYVLAHVLDHAQDAGLLDEVLNDPGLLMRPEPAEFLARVDLAAHPGLQAIAAVQADPAARGSRLEWALAAARLGLADLAARAANLAPPLAWQPAWTFGSRGADPAEAGDSPEAVELARLASPVLLAAMSADGGIVASYSETGGLWVYGRSRAGRRLSGAWRITALAVSPGGRYVITGDSVGMMRVWDLVSEGSRTFQTGSRGLAAVSISDARRIEAFRDDGIMVTGEGDRVPRIGRGSRAVNVTLPPAPSDEIVRLLGGDTQNYLEVTKVNGDALLLSAGEITVVDDPFDSPIRAAAWSAGLGLVVTGREDGSVVRWDVEAGRSRIIGRHDGPVLCLAISAAGLTVASGGADGSLRVWDLAAPEIPETGGRAAAMTICDGAVLVVGDADDVHPLDLDTGQPLWAPLTAPRRVTGLSVPAIEDQHGVLLRHDDGTATLWLPGADSLREVGTWLGGLVTGRPAYLLEGRLVEVGAEDDGTLLVRDVTADPLPTGIVASARIAGQLVAVTAEGQALQVWDVTGQQVTDDFDVGARIWALALSADGHLAVCAGGEVIVFRHASARRIASVKQ